MKTFRTFALLVSTAVLLGLGGCAGTYKPKDILTQFNPGEQSIYVVVPGAPKKLTEIKDYAKHCGKQELTEIMSSSVNTWTAENVCPDIAKWQRVAGVYQTKVWGMEGLKTTTALAPSNMHIEADDILEVNLFISRDGLITKPGVVKRIARKAKDATKESGCYWDGGKGATTAFIGGGAVCDGWNWRDQKFAKE
ncbi:hypothetical protein [Limnohabitans lacus]|uniref:Lipoprotein n=1 Tax=Limnohabitans lacus TaxID=3045173 RepID=A0ABT6XAN6_9BURK|nr:hypothetical protein [Limnohabitans sp. HM2-2]MDI9235197.1 hypothetical protein [Limnohabitans sp. HM2-2]